MFKKETHSFTDRPSACSTDATRMDNSLTRQFTPGTISPVSIELSVRNALEQVCSRVVNLSGSQCLEIVESLLICFLARKSGKEKMFTQLEYGRFIRSMEQTSLVLLEYQSDDCKEQTFCKYWLDTYMARVFHDDARPERPDWLKRNLFTGYCKRYVDRRILHGDSAFIYSLAKGSKQMWPPLREANVRQSIRKSIQRLANPRQFSEMPFDLELTIRSISADIFHDIKTDPQNIGSKFMPSMSACIGRTIKDGGIKTLFHPLKPLDAELTKKLGKLRSADLVVNQWRQDTFSFAVADVQSRLNNIVDPDGVVKDYKGAGVFDTVFVPIFEPGKIRSISKSDGYLATALQPLQGQMLSCWKSTRWSTMLDDDLTAAVIDMDKNVKEEYFCSGDYEDATNLLFRRSTILAFDGVSRKHPLNMLAYLSLTSGSMYYPDPDLPWPKSGNQPTLKLGLFEGQLMGHTLSFPLLCVINLSVLSYSIQSWWQSATTIEDKRDRRKRGKLIYKFAKINGDDILFKAPLELIEIFKKSASLVGFKISQGKNYVSKDMCLINSQMFQRKGVEMVRVGYLNLRLVKGMNIKGRKAANENPVNPTYIGKDLGKMARLTPWTASVIPLAMKRWIKYTKTFSWFQPNWYLPVHLGGYGVPLELAPSCLKITRGQRLVAALFINNPDLLLFRTVELNPSKKFKLLGKLNPRVVRGDTVLESHEVDISFDPNASDPWLERMAYINHAAWDTYWDVNPDAGMMHMCSQLKHHSRLKPLSLDNLLNYLTIRLIATRMPPCPPLRPIKLLFDPVLS